MMDAWVKQLSPAMTNKLLQAAREKDQVKEAVAVTDQLIVQAHMQYVMLLVGGAVLTALLWQIGHDSPFKVNREAKKALAPEDLPQFQRAARRNPLNLALQIIPAIVALAAAGLFAYHIHEKLNDTRTELNGRILAVRSELVELYEESSP